ncbi:MAG: gamma-glutamyltransferase [Deltaproteobacteria bacterium]|nr:gamma-glutamyltransferase [Deltaproteobacteria bacterium]
MANSFTSHRPVVMGTNWMITADHPLAAQAGAAVLESGGNAVDAAVAANLALTVVRPHMCGLGGDLFALIYQAQNGRMEALNASGRSPYKATREHYLNLGFKAIPEDGLLTATVPGAIDGWQAALEKYGTRSLADLLPRAISYAKNGFPVYPELAQAIEKRALILAESPAAAKIFLPGGEPPRVGERLVQTDLAGSLKLLASQSRDAFYRGQLGEALVRFSEKAGGLFSQKDLLNHTHNWGEPLKQNYKGLTICTLPPNSQGIALLMQMAILENFDLAGLGHNTADSLHLLVEAKKLAFADRDKYVCDPDFHPVPVDQMLSSEQIRKQAGRIDRQRAATAVKPRDFLKGGQDTVYLAVVDKDGNAVSLIQSLYESFGSCVMIPDTGIILHNRGRGFTLDPDHVNCLQPHKRPYHTLHSTIVLKDGRPYLVLGTPGADGQTQTVTQLLMNHLEFGANVQEAVEAPRFRSNPDGSLFLEGRFAAEAVRSLKDKGHIVQVVSDWDEVMGSSQIIGIDRGYGIIMAGADPRRQAYAIGS